MKMPIFAFALGAILLCGCASNKPAEPKPIRERPWIGGQFETVPTPRSIRTNSPAYGKEAPLLAELREGTPLQKAGLAEGDLILAVNHAKVRHAGQILKMIDKNGASPVPVTIYRNGEILEKTVSPGFERYQELGLLTFGISLSSHLEFDLIPNPDFSLVALGYREERDRLDLRSPKSKYLSGLAAREAKPVDQDASGLRSDEGWKFWLGPFSIEKRKSILSQE